MKKERGKNMKKKYRGFPSSPLQALTHLVPVFKLDLQELSCVIVYFDASSKCIDSEIILHGYR